MLTYFKLHAHFQFKCPRCIEINRLLLCFTIWIDAEKVKRSYKSYITGQISLFEAVRGETNFSYFCVIYQLVYNYQVCTSSYTNICLKLQK